VKPRHAAALALIGWYLMAPPVHPVSKTMYEWDSSRSLSEWMIVASFDTAAECRRDMYRREDAPKLTGAGKRFAESLVCIASNDPRLVE
jgi:hypothetical protein